MKIEFTGSWIAVALGMILGFSIAYFTFPKERHTPPPPVPHPSFPVK